MQKNQAKISLAHFYLWEYSENPLPNVKEKQSLPVVKVVKTETKTNFTQELWQSRKRNFSVELGSTPNTTWTIECL